MAIDYPIGVDAFVVVVVSCVFCVGVCFWHRCVGVFFGHRCVCSCERCGGRFFVPKYLKCLSTSGFMFPVSNHTE